MKVLGKVVSVLWFFTGILFVLFVQSVAILMILFSDIPGMLKSGFSNGTVGFIFIFITNIPLALTGWIPVLRKCYYKLPWLYPLVTINSYNLMILSIAEEILSKGFSVISTPRHVITVILMIIEIVGLRLLMSWYLKKNPLVLKKYDRIE